MSEKFKEEGEQLSPAQAIAKAIEDWLTSEIESSGTGRNAVLDKVLPQQGYDFISGGKTEGHYNRLKLWTTQFAEDVEDDYITARQIFAIHMELSGMFRIQCFVRSGPNERFYRNLRFNSGRSLGTDINKQVRTRLLEHSSYIPDRSDLTTYTIGHDELLEITGDYNESLYQYLKKLGSREKPDSPMRKVQTIQRLQNIQRDWLNLATDYIIFAGQQRGGQLSNVPFLEPKSISDNPGVYYPFTSGTSGNLRGSEA
jgi:hypothetical protein